VIVSRAGIRRPVTVSMVFIGLAMIGMFASFRLPIEQFPEVEVPYVGIGIPYNNSTAQEVERNLTRPVEEVLSTMRGIDRMFTFSRPALLYVHLGLDHNGDVAGKGIEAKELIEGIRHRLPEDVRYINLRQEDPNSTPLMNVMIVSPDLDEDEAFDLLDSRVRAELERVPGVNSVNLYGIVRQYVQVSIDRERTWSLAKLEKPLSSYSWVFWSLACTFPKAGRYTIAVRAADQFSGIQQDDLRDPFPNGTSGIHRIEIQVV